MFERCGPRVTDFFMRSTIRIEGMTSHAADFPFRAIGRTGSLRQEGRQRCQAHHHQRTCARADRGEALAAKPFARGEHDERTPHAACAPSAPLGVRLLSKRQVLTIINVSYPTLWSWMRRGKFPRSRVVGGKSMWISTEVQTWLAALPVRKLKGDAPEARVGRVGH